MKLDEWVGLPLNKQLLSAVDSMGFVRPTDIQRMAIPRITGGEQVVGIAQTGTGKTASFILPLLMKIKYAQGHDPRALILEPTKELVLQVADHARQLGQYTDIRIIALYGGVGPKTQIQQLKEGVDLIVATPGRFMELYLDQWIVVKQIKTLVIDEADRMMDMGFIRQLHRIFEVIPSRRQNLLFSATFPSKVESLAEEFISFPVKLYAQSHAIPKTIKQFLYHLPNLKTKINLLSSLLQYTDELKRVIVFVRSKKRADQVFRYIYRKRFGTTLVLHANKAQNTRINVMKKFHNGEIRILVCTDVVARGIHVTDVSHVINFDLPRLPEDYIHRVGRTGRVSNKGVAITFVTPDEINYVRRIEKLIGDKIPSKPLPQHVIH